jgi:amino acid transporter
MPTAAPVAQAVPEGLRRQLGLASTTAAVIGGIIAVGIFLTPAGMARALGSPMWLLAVWLAVGATTLSGALCYGELAGRFPRAGGAYVYLRESYGPRTAFLFGWMCLLVMDPAVAVAQIHPRFGTPANAIVIQGAIFSFLVFMGSFEQIISYALFIVVFFLGLTVSGLFILRPRQKAAASVVLTPGYPVTPFAFLVLAALMLVLVAVHSPRGALLGVVVVSAGLPVYEIFRRRLTVVAVAETG